MAPELFKSIILGGGNCSIRHFKQRIEQDLESLKPIDCELNVYGGEQPELAAWRGLKLFSSPTNDSCFAQHVVTQDEYFEEGPRIFNKFVL